MSNHFSSINDLFVTYQSLDYGTVEPEGEVKLDCSLGVNADLLDNCVFDTLHDFQQKTLLNDGHYAEIKFYPHDDSITESLARWYRANGVGEEWLTGQNFIMGNGSYEILCNLNIFCLTNGRKVLGHAPQFTAYIDNVYCTGSDYDYVVLSKYKNYRFDVDDYLAAISEDHAMFIIENPNNPTGQLIPLEALEQVAAKALQMNRILVIDEAYGDYLPFEATAVNLTGKYPNVIVTRSFSKGWGMAGLRIGYAVMSTETDTLDLLRKIELGFSCNALARSLARTALDSQLESGYDPFSTETVKRNELKLIETVGKLSDKYSCPLKIAETHDSTPILTLYCDTEDEGLDLQAHLMKYGLLTVSCSTYIGLDRRAVRIMLPEEEHMGLMFNILENACKDLT
ncbi:MAG: histidinol-phosphate aminotransferase family protein [Clostridiales bacterium]|nr:histidinol-phosphate aminotransferase family protein [Candidatus Crickella merdequi]